MVERPVPPPIETICNGLLTTTGGAKVVSIAGGAINVRLESHGLCSQGLNGCTGPSGGDDAVAVASFAARLLLRKPKPCPNPLLQKPDHNQGNGRNQRRLAGKGIRFARADNLA